MMIPDLNDINLRLAATDAPGVLEWGFANFPGRVVFSSSLGLEDQVITDMIYKLGNKAGVFTLDTGRLFPETYDLIDITCRRYDLKMTVWFPDGDQVREMVMEHGINLFYDHPDKRKLCCRIRKTEPLKKALAGYDIWITGLRREQSDSRSELTVAEFDDSLGMIKLNPLISWSSEDVWNYIRTHKVPYNTLHDKGYPSIGCQPCTRAVGSGEDIRAGRWWWESSSRECGIHVKNK